MIDIRELRIGNWVQCEYFENPMKIDDLCLSTYYGDIYDPIVLTDELLIANGFIGNESYSYIGLTGIISLCRLSDGYYYDKTCIKHLHHLQNLVFALSGSELKIQL